MAQTALPDIAGASDKGIVILSWNCQYNGVKSINVLRSTDSVYFYSAIGKVKKLDKGTQAFVDGHPVPGKNYYKLVIQFNSGLTWTSNHCSVVIEGAPAQLPPNDSIQRYIVTNDTAKTKKTTKATTVAAAKPPVKDNLAVDPEDLEDTPAPKGQKQAADPDNDEADSTANKPVVPTHKVYISFDMDPTPVTKSTITTDKRPGDYKKVTISFEEPDETSKVIRSLYVYADPATGHITLNLPPDVATHHYSIKFYNDQNQMIIEVPKLNATKIILDKRNFQRKGTFKFVLRKDVTELESGYVEIK